ncbi:MAG: hypothetical protein EXR75_09510 [Myxococcales bacterium]|nr:hypothetical protein [Myxococcales bacterium]
MPPSPTSPPMPRSPRPPTPAPIVPAGPSIHTSPKLPEPKAPSSAAFWLCHRSSRSIRSDSAARTRSASNASRPSAIRIASCSCSLTSTGNGSRVLAMMTGAVPAIMGRAVPAMMGTAVPAMMGGGSGSGLTATSSAPFASAQPASATRQHTRAGRGQCDIGEPQSARGRECTWFVPHGTSLKSEARTESLDCNTTRHISSQRAARRPTIYRMPTSMSRAALLATALLANSMALVGCGAAPLKKTSAPAHKASSPANQAIAVAASASGAAVIASAAVSVQAAFAALPRGAYARAGSRALRHRPGVERSVAALDGALFIASEHHGGTLVEDVLRGETIATIAVPSHDTAMSNDGKVLAIIGAREAWIHELPSGRQRVVLALREPQKMLGKAAAFEDARMAGMLGNIAGYSPTSVAADRFALSADGSVFAITLSGANDVLVFDARSGARTHRIVDAAGEGELLLSADGRRLVTFPKLPIASADSSAGGELGVPERKANIWDLATGVRVAELANIGDGRVALALSPDGARIAVLGKSSLAISQVGTEAPLHTRDFDKKNDEPEWGFGLGSPLSVAVVFSPDGALLAYHREHGITVLDAASLEERGTYETKDDVAELVFSSDARRLAAVTRTGEALWIDVVGRTRTAPIAGHIGKITSLSFSRDGALLASTAEDGALNLWDAGTGRLLRASERKGGYFAAAFTAEALTVRLHDGRVLVVGSRDRGESPAVRALGEPTYGTHAMAITRGGETLAFQLGNFWDKEDRVRVQVMRTDGQVLAESEIDKPLAGLAFSADARMLAVLAREADAPAGLILLDVTSGAVLDSFDVADLAPTSLLGFSNTGDAVVVGESERVVLVDMRERRPFMTIATPTPPGCVPVRTLSRDGRTVASAACGTAIRLFSTTTGAALGSFDVDRNAHVTAMAFDPGTERLAVGTDDGTTVLYRVREATPPAPPATPPSP